MSNNKYKKDKYRQKTTSARYKIWIATYKIHSLQMKSNVVQ